MNCECCGDLLKDEDVEMCGSLCFGCWLDWQKMVAGEERDDAVAS